MKFGKQLQLGTYEPWKDYYIQYSKLKRIIKRRKFVADKHKENLRVHAMKILQRLLFNIHKLNYINSKISSIALDMEQAGTPVHQFKWSS
jgi:SPX domain protein involved in polyphosphate accumulation